MSTQKPIWTFPWGYGESFAAALGIFLAGTGIQFISGINIPLPAWPLNLILLLCFIAVLVITQRVAGKNPVVRWLSSVPAAISAIALFTVLSLLMGFIHQDVLAPADLLFANIKFSWMYLFAQVYILTTLGMTTIRRFSLRKRNIGFMLNHLGIWLVLAAASFGAGDIERYTLQVQKGNIQWIGEDEYGNTHELPVAIALHEFTIEFYAPQAGIWDTKKEILLKKPSFALESKDSVFSWKEYTFRISQVKSSAWLMGETFRDVAAPGAVNAAFVEITAGNSTPKKGWICAASSLHEPSTLAFGDSYELVMKPPKPKLFKSDITIYTEQGSEVSTSLIVNQPITVDGWKIYQYGYDEAMGKYSDISIFELVRDPWLPVIYSGLILLIGGAVFMFINGVGTRKKQS